jgi:putative inorganic carbon (HCO3(-)) transporter
MAGGQRPWSEITRDKLWKWPFIMVFFVLASMGWASVTTYTYNVFTLILGYLILFVLIARIITTPKRLRGLFVTLIVAHLFLLVYNPLVVTDPYTRHYITGATFLGDGNDYSLSLVILLPFAIELLQSAQTKIGRILGLAALGVLILAIVGTQSRGATLGMGMVFAYLWWRTPRKVPGIVAICVALFGVLLYAPDVYLQRMKTLKNPEQESSAEARLKAWKAGARMAQDNFLGVGAGNFPNNFPKYRGADAPVRWMTAHSMYFLALGELGILGLLLVIRLVAGNIIANVRQRNLLSKMPTGPPATLVQIRLLNLVNASALGLAVSGAFLSVTYYPHLFMLTAIFICTRSFGTGIGNDGVPAPASPPKPSRFARLRGKTVGA